ncbi:MAG TPA: NUDIX domain-containing protein [Bryobacteraceae bacterium]|nr:NUDIX domain-containing protein [Bryobacteraceae bacterium]
MIDRQKVAALIRCFSDLADGQTLKSCELAAMLLECSPEPFSRRQYTPGHITCTGLVLAPDGLRMLLVHHARLGRWLAPGGHIEPEDAEIWDGARREVIEETGVELASDGIPRFAGADVHGIPAEGSEPYHLHHDLLFAFHAVSDRFRLSHESLDIAWCAPADFERYQVPANLLRAYARVRELSSTR